MKGKSYACVQIKLFFFFLFRLWYHIVQLSGKEDEFKCVTRSEKNNFVITCPFRESSLVTLSRNFEEIHIILIMINICTCKYVKKGRYILNVSYYMSKTFRFDVNVLKAYLNNLKAISSNLQIFYPRFMIITVFINLNRASSDNSKINRSND